MKTKRPQATKKRVQKSSRKQTKLRVLEVELPPTVTKEQLADIMKTFESQIIATTGVARLVMDNKARAPRRQATRSGR